MRPDLVTPRKWYFLATAIIIALGLASLLIPPGLKLGIEFTSGSTMTLRFTEREVTQAGLRQALREIGYEPIIQRLGKDEFFVRLRRIGREEKVALEKALSEKLGKLEVLDFYDVSPIVARETGRNAAIAIAAAAVGILLYIAWAFRRMPRAFHAGACAVIALVHDVLIVLSVFSILGRLFNIQVDALFITAVLAVVGYSVNNTVVVFDRLRENLGKAGRKANLSLEVNRSLVETVSRSLNTSLTTLFVMIALILFGGVTIKNFVLALIIGLVAGTYSSLFLAAQIWLTWREGLGLRGARSR